MSVPSATSVSHQHIAAVINTLLQQSHASSPIRILDFGCGNGRLISYLHEALPVLRRDIDFHIFGLDVTDAGQQVPGYMSETHALLGERHQNVDWQKRVSLITTENDWPYPDSFFDFVVSNAVMEHVTDHDFVFGEIRRCLKPDGTSVNLFPLREVVWEGHASMPFVHQVTGVEQRERAMRALARIGFRAHYHRTMARGGWLTLEQFAHDFSRVLETDTNYLTKRQLVRKSERANLAVSFTYTKDFFLAKARSFIRRPSYFYNEQPIRESIGVLMGKYISDVTVLLRHPQVTSTASRRP